MPVLFLNVEDGRLESQLPGHLQRVRIGDLHPGLEPSSKYFLGLVSQSYPLTKLGNGRVSMKAILEKPESEPVSSEVGAINIFAFGKLAEECAKRVHIGDSLAITGFKIVRSPSGNKDGRYYCQLELDDESASSVYICKSEDALAEQAESTGPKQKYIYTPLDQLKKNTVVNVFGVVTFFKPPLCSKGTDYYSLITITDQSSVKLTCMLFSGNPDFLPKVFKNGDIVRFHRLRIKEYKNEKQGSTSAGFSSLVFDGTPGAPVIPRTSSKTFCFSEEDHRTVEVLRSWACSQVSSSRSSVILSAVQPATFLDLTCQLVGKAEVDSCSFLLKVWDGTKFQYPQKVCVVNGAVEGDPRVIHQLRNLTVDILVFDNHAQEAKSLAVGSYLSIYNLHAKCHTSCDDDAKIPCIEFQLHGGTGFGRGIAVLPQNSYCVQELQRRLGAVDPQDYQDLEGISSLEFNDTLNEPSDRESLSTSTNQDFFPTRPIERCQQSSATVLTAHQHVRTTELHIIKKSTAPQKYRIRAKLTYFEPQVLSKSVKLHCPKCNSLLEIPDEEDLNFVLQDCAAMAQNQSLPNTALYNSFLWTRENQEEKIAVHFFKKENWSTPQETMIMIEGGSLQEMYKLSGQFHSVIPVRSEKEHLFLTNLSVPYLFQGKHCYYGCKQCSRPKSLEGLFVLMKSDSYEPDAVAAVLGIVPLQYVVIMKFTFSDGTGSLDAYLWNCSEQFFQIQASEILVNDAMQEKLHDVMNILCPSRAKLDDHPWLECCIRSYNNKDETKPGVLYQIFDTVFAE
ncbi:hypothetical protein NDU88_002397 [Pleurodeles waltl]|uniref:Protection of telomeres protein 1 n=1 Tax=Pleurodeles waltl TaxID=8319 RepID=A0AAV7MRB0_PLEWA|nr:hypothetical protein NDU88_002397 [Pleurodeles waltl]